MKLLLLADAYRAFEDQVENDLNVAADRRQMRKHVNTTIFLQALKKRGPGDRPMKILLGSVLFITVLFLPLATLFITQGKFLAYQSDGVTWWHRFLVLIDIAAMSLAIVRVLEVCSP